MIALTLSTAAAGADFDYGLLAGGSYSDNVLRTPVDEQSSGAAVVGFDVRGERTTGRLLYDLYGDLEYRDYLEDAVDSQTFGRLVARSSYGFVPETFEWLLSGSFDQVREDLMRPIAPGNVEDVITLSTGPRLTLNFSDTVEAQTEMHYTVANYSVRDADNATAGAVLTVGRRMSERTYFGLGGSYDDVRYDVASGRVAPDYKRHEYFLRFNTEGVRTTFEADVGFTKISGVGVDDDGPMARARLTRQLTPYVSAFLGYTREFPTSEGASYAPAPAQGELVEDSSILTAAPRENESTELGLVMTRPRTTATLIVARRTEKTLGIGEADRDYDEASATLERLITTRSTFGLYATYMKEKIDGVIVDPLLTSVDSDSDETAFGANLMLAFGRAIGVEVRVEHRERDSNVASGSFKELSGGIFLRYGSPRRQARLESQPAL